MLEMSNLLPGHLLIRMFVAALNSSSSLKQRHREYRLFYWDIRKWTYSQKNLLHIQTLSCFNGFDPLDAHHVKTWNLFLFANAILCTQYEPSVWQNQFQYLFGYVTWISLVSNTYSVLWLEHSGPGSQRYPSRNVFNQIPWRPWLPHPVLNLSRVIFVWRTTRLKPNLQLFCLINRY